MATDAARTTRLAALMAAHGFVFIKLFDVVAANGNFRWLVAILTLSPIAGMGMAYAALRQKETDKGAQKLELSSALTLLAAYLAWLLDLVVLHR